jgi:rubrerythrin
MTEAESRLVEAIKFAIQMELDGKKFYSLSGEQSTNPVGKELFAWLAKQEDHHRQTFEKIYKSIADKQGWLSDHVKPAKAEKMGTLFGEAIKNAGKDIVAKKGEVEAALKAMDMEIKSRDYYNKQADLASNAAEKSFFTAIAAEEQGHYLGLIDYREYITDPVDWFTRTEHHLLEGA